MTSARTLILALGLSFFGLWSSAAAQELCLPEPAVVPCASTLRLALDPLPDLLWLSGLAITLEGGLFSGEGGQILARLADAHGASDVRGVQVGAVNWARDVRGLQIGGVNVARRLRGAQIGGALISYESPARFYVGVSLGWYGRSSG